MIKRLQRWVVFGTLAGMIAFAASCSKTDNNNNSSSNNNNNNNNPSAPKIGLGYYKKNWTPQDLVQISVGAKAVAAGATVKTIFRDDAMGDTATLVLGSDDSTQDLYFVPASFASGNINLKYTVKDSKGNTSSVTAVLTIGGKVKIFKNYSGAVGTQLSSYQFLNTGGALPSGNPPTLMNLGELNANNRNLIDLVGAISAKGQHIICAPSSIALDSISFYNMNVWTDAQRNKTQLKKLAQGTDITKFKSGSDVQAAFDASKNPVWDRVNNLVPTDAYAFKCVDGRYGAFSVAGFDVNGGSNIGIYICAESR